MAKNKRKMKRVEIESVPMSPVMKGNVLATFIAEVQAMSQELVARRETGIDFVEFCQSKKGLAEEFEAFRNKKRGLA